jgi:hypothetical protein
MTAPKWWVGSATHHLLVSHPRCVSFHIVAMI